MHAMVVVESLFGNTRTVADAVADGLSGAMDVEVVDVGAAPTVIEGGLDLLVVGGPTHAFGMTRPETRRSAAEQSGRNTVPEVGLREWLAALAPVSTAIPAATFDTRVKAPVPGSAGRAAARRLGKLGFRVVAPVQRFVVSGTPGPLVEGEQARARRWGDTLAATIVKGADRPDRG